MIDKDEIEKIVRSEIEKRLSAELSSIDLGQMLGEMLIGLVQDKANATATSMINTLIQQGKFNNIIDKTLATRIEDKIDEAVKNKAAASVSRTI